MASHVPPSSRLSRRGLLRLGGAVAAAGAAGPLLSACTTVPESATGGGEDTFTLYTSAGHAYETWAEIIKQFEKDHKVTVNWQKFQWPDMRTKLQADFSAGNVADLVEQPSGAEGLTYAVNGEALSLEEYISKDGAEMGFPDDWHEHAVDAWTYQGKRYGVQLMLTIAQIYYDKQLLSKAGISEPPGTWDDFLAAAKELTTGKVHGFAINQDHSYSWPWLLQNGVTYFDDAAGDFLTPHDKAMEALQFQADLVHKHKVSPVPVASSDYSGPRNLLVAGRAAMISTGPWDIKPIRTAKPELDLGIGLPLQRAERATMFAGAGMFIPKKSKKADMAWDLIKRITTLENELKLTKEANQTMPRATWAKDPAVTGDPLIGAVAEGIPYARHFHGELGATGKVNQVDEAYKTLYQSVVMSNRPVEAEFRTFLDTAKKALDS